MMHHDVDEDDDDVQAPEEMEPEDKRALLLSASAWLKIQRVAVTGYGVCARCHWRSGCDKCDYEKAVRYWLCKEKWSDKTW